MREIYYDYFIYINIFLSVIYSISLMYFAIKPITIFQLSSYRCSGLKEWYYNKNKKIYIKNILFTCFIALFSIILSIIDIAQYYAILLVVIIIVNFVRFRIDSKIKEKKKLVVTYRVKRLFIVLGLVSVFYMYLLLYFSMYYNYKSLLFVVVIVNHVWIYLICLSNILVYPIEQLIKKHYKILAIKKIKKIKNLIVVGITGSYGKTSTKFILTQILKEKYFTLCTPHSYNTPMGITKTILNQLKAHHEIFVVEMGADKKNDINKICEIIKPNISIITSIGKQHLKTFKTLDNIINTKYQIVENLNDSGSAIFNVSNEYVKGLYYKNCSKNKISVSVNEKEADIFASSIKANEDGCEFFVNYKNKKFKIKTSLIGEHNIINILNAIAVALLLGVDIDKIKRAVLELKQVKSRLELIKATNGSIIIDDSFNSNPKGCEAALKVLGMYVNRVKMVVTPGMVELGDEAYNENFIFGQLMANVANDVYIVNDINKKAIYDGLISKNFNEDNIHFYATFDEAFFEIKQLLTNNHILLIENDLPDNYV